MRRIRIGFVAAVLAATGIAGGCVYNTPSPGLSSVFNDVATISKTDVWAVGSTCVLRSCNTTRALIEHFDGRNWTVVAAPNAAGDALSSVTAVSATDVWAVGGGSTLHWDGHAWSATADPAGLQLTSVKHGHGGLVMALGENTSTHKVEVLSRTAASWQPIAIPTPPARTSGRACDGSVAIYALAPLTASDLWVAGSTYAATSACPYVAHWNGTAWTTYATPDTTGSHQTELVAISARADGTVWAVGHGHFYDAQFNMDTYPGLAVRWNGSTWQSICTGDCVGDNFVDIDATGKSVWAAAINPRQPGPSTVMFIERWVGNGWATQKAQFIPNQPQDGLPQNFLTSVSVRGGLVASAGSFASNGRVNPLIDLRSDG